MFTVSGVRSSTWFSRARRVRFFRDRPKVLASKVWQVEELMPKSKLTTGALCLLFGWLGVHRFYTGHTRIGFIQLLTGGGLGIWAVWDFVQIVRNRYADVHGHLLAT